MKNYTLRLTLKGPVLFQAAGTTALGVDTAAQRYQGTPVINGSLIKGNLRHAFEDFVTLLPKNNPLKTKINHWFGEKSANEANNDAGFAPYRGCVQFGMFWTLINPVDNTGLRTRIAINDQGVVTRGALQTIEDIAPVGCPDPIFAGEIKTDFASDKEERLFLLWLERALSFIPALGSMKGIGFGQLVDFEVVETSLPHHPLEPLDGTPSRILVQIDFDRPFCIGAPRTPDSNLIFSPVEIPGGTIKGLIAATFGNDSDLLAKKFCFDELVFSHFKPVAVTQSVPEDQSTCESPATQAPLSVAVVDDNVYDFSLVDEEALTLDSVPRFKPDWKLEDTQSVNTALKRSPTVPQKHVVVRTGIDPSTETATEGALFSLECVTTDTHTWQGFIDLSQIDPDRRASIIAALHETLSSGLHNLGKTSAASQSIRWQAAEEQTFQLLEDDIAVVVLQTPATLFQSGFEDRFSQGANIADEYTTYWETGGNAADFSLIKYFAAQHRAGGAHYYWRYQRSQNYRPAWLTVAGSVFVVKVHTKQGKDKLQQWAKTGLPAATQQDGTATTWHHSPYIAENGYGEIRINEASLMALRYILRAEQHP